MFSVYVFALFYAYIEHPAYDRLIAINWVETWQARIYDMPLWLIIPVNFIIADFAAYWVHRLLHSSWFWHSHAWHHSPKYIYWLSGLRGSLIHTILILFPCTLTYLFIPTPEAGLAITLILIVNILNRQYTHSDIRLPLQKQLEFVFVTPRYHLVHHSSTRICNDSNYGFVFSCRDRLFGTTYTDPATIDVDDPLGLSDEISNIRLLIGIPASKAQKTTKDTADYN